MLLTVFRGAVYCGSEVEARASHHEVASRDQLDWGLSKKVKIRVVNADFGVDTMAESGMISCLGYGGGSAHSLVL